MSEGYDRPQGIKLILTELKIEDITYTCNAQNRNLYYTCLSLQIARKIHRESYIAKTANGHACMTTGTDMDLQQ